LKSQTTFTHGGSPDDLKYDAYVKTSSDSGVTWSAETKILDAAAIDGDSTFRGVTICDADGKIWVIGANWRDLEGDIYANKYSGGAWSGQSMIFDGTYSTGAAHLDAIVEGNNIRLFYGIQQESQGVGFIKYQAGGPWDTTVTKIGASAGYQIPRVIKAGSTYYLVSTDWSNILFTKTTTPNTVPWPDATLLFDAPSGGAACDPTILKYGESGGTDDLIIFSSPSYSDNSQPIEYIYSTDAGSSWASSIPFTEAAHATQMSWDMMSRAYLKDAGTIMLFYGMEQRGVNRGQGDVVVCDWSISATIGNEHYTAIQDGIDAAGSGDTILVYDGVYREQLLINKSLTIRAIGNPIIEAPDTRNTYKFTESTATFDPIIFAYGGTMISGTISGPGTIDITIDGFEIDGRNKAVSARFVGILYRNVNPGGISNCSIHHMYDSDGQGNGPETFGILVYGNSDVAVEQNEVRDFSRGGIGIQGDNGAQPDPIATVKRNTVVGNGLEVGTNWCAENGIQMGWGAGGSIIENNVSQCIVNNPSWASTGILVISAAQGVEILRNSVADCDTCIAMSVVSSPCLGVIEGNNVTRATWDAIRLGLDGPCDQCTVSNNIISDSWAGIGVWDSSDNTIKGNTIRANQYGIIIDGNSNNNNVTQNSILDSTVDGIIVEPYGGYDPTETQISYNNIAGNAVYGIEQTGANLVDADSNWWGDPTGPYDPILNPSGLGDHISGHVDFEPWLIQPYPPATLVGTLLYVNPASAECWTVAYGKTFTVDVRVEDVTDLFTYEYKLYWDTTLLDLVHVHIINPWSQFATGKNETSEDLGRLWVAFSAYGVPPFSGSTTIAELTFKTTYDPIYPENKTCKLDLSDTILLAPFAEPIYHMVHDGQYTIYSTKPKIKVEPDPYTAHSKDKIFNVTVTVSDVVNLYNFTFQLSYNTTLLEATNLLVGPFLNPPVTTFQYGIDNLNGKVWLWVWSTGGAAPANGSGVLATITFKVKLVSLWKKNNPHILSCALALSNTMLKTSNGIQVSHDAINGAYRYEPKPGDLNYDGRVSLADLMIVAYWYDPAYKAVADLNEDGKVNAVDLNLVASYYGEDC
jgi:parallel beta-helix repeat protein